MATPPDPKSLIQAFSNYNRGVVKAANILETVAGIPHPVSIAGALKWHQFKVGGKIYRGFLTAKQAHRLKKAVASETVFVDEIQQRIADLFGAVNHSIIALGPGLDPKCPGLKKPDVVYPPPSVRCCYDTGKVATDVTLSQCTALGGRQC